MKNNLYTLKRLQRYHNKLTFINLNYIKYLFYIEKLFQGKKIFISYNKKINSLLF